MKTQPNLDKVQDLAVREDIRELQQKITDFRQGKIEEERFKHYRLTRGVYGQRQMGVQMFRIKIPFGRLNPKQLIRIAEISEKYATGNLHLTTRQNIQLHFVNLENAPTVWTLLGEVGLHAREACGNTVRNLTASAMAGIDPLEPFDVSPYVWAMYKYFLRNPVCEDMGRKIKPAFSSSEKDSAFTYFHDFGFIPRIQKIDGVETRGFKVVIGGGLGAQSIVAPTAFEFLPADQIIPFTEACIRVFDRYGEREKRFKARMKFLVQKLGLEEFMRLVDQEMNGLKSKLHPIDPAWNGTDDIPGKKDYPVSFSDIEDQKEYSKWLSTSIVEQKQPGFYAVRIKVKLGDIKSDIAKKLAKIISETASGDMRITVNQGLLLRFVRPEALPYLYTRLKELGLGEPGFGTIMDITACPGTDTCNLGVTNSTALAETLETYLQENYPEMIDEKFLEIKISGCMNSCGQHMAANIGLHGSSIRVGKRMLPAMQVVLGGGVDDKGRGFVAERVIKLPTRRIPLALGLLIEDYRQGAKADEFFNDYFQRLGKMYFYQLLKPLADVDEVEDSEFIDWGQEKVYKQAIGVGECAGVAYDMVSAIMQDGRERLERAWKNFEEGSFAHSVYFSYSAFIITAKALLLSKDVKCNTHAGIIKDFEEHFAEEQLFDASFSDFVMQMSEEKPDAAFAQMYCSEARAFLERAERWRESTIHEEKSVIENYYKA